MAGPDTAAELTEQHRQTYRFYQECRATGRFPDDPLVRWAAAVIREVEEACARVTSQRAAVAALSLLRDAGGD